MKKLFVSYRRKSWSFAHRLVEKLQARLAANIFVDLTGVDETNFEHAILRNLYECDAVLLIVSEHTFDPARISQESDWVRREIALALELDKPIVLARIEGQPLPQPSDLPADIRDILKQEARNFYPDFFDAGVQSLAEFIAKTTPIPLRRTIWQRRIALAGLLAAVVVIAGIGFASLRLPSTGSGSAPTTQVIAAASVTATTLLPTASPTATATVPTLTPSPTATTSSGGPTATLTACPAATDQAGQALDVPETGITGELIAQLNSLRGDYIGGGRGNFTLRSPARLTLKNNMIHLETPGGLSWRYDFYAADLQVGKQYDRATVKSPPTASGQTPMMNVEANSSSCSFDGVANAGQFTIDRQSPVIVIHFKQTCNSDLKGTLTFMPDTTIDTYQSAKIIPAALSPITGENASRLALITEYEGHSSAASRIVLSGDGKFMASVGSDNIIRIREVATGTYTDQSVKTSRFGGMAFVPKTEQLLYSDGKSIHEFDLKTSKSSVLWQVPPPPTSPGPTATAGGFFPSDNSLYTEGLAVSPDGKLAAFGGGQFNILILNLATNTRQTELRGDLGYSINDLAFNESGTRLASSGGFPKDALRLWDVTSGKQLSAIGYAGQIAFSPDGSLLAESGYGDAAVRLWDAGTGQPFRVLKLTDSGGGFAFMPNGPLLAVAGGADHAIHIWNYQTGEQVAILSNPFDWFTDVAFSPDGKLLISVGSEGIERVWGVPSSPPSGPSPTLLPTFTPNPTAPTATLSPAQVTQTVQAMHNEAGGPVLLGSKQKGTISATLYSSPGEWIGDGKGDFTLEGEASLDSSPAKLTVTKEEFGGSWGFDFGATELRVGKLYDNTRPYFSTDTDVPSIDINSPGRGCLVHTGWFRVEQQSPVLTVSFMQFCENDPAHYLKGTLTFTPK